MTALHRLREGYKEERTACMNRIRGLLAEFGPVFAQRPDVLRAALSEVIEDASNAGRRALCGDDFERMEPC
jgi:transposase